MYKDRKVQKEYQHGWYLRKKAGLPTRLHPKLSDKERRQRKKISQSKWSRKVRGEKKRIISEKLGSRCFICGFDKRLACHRKDGLPHNDTDFNGTNISALEKINFIEYVRVCYKCHKNIHWCMKHLNMVWDDIEKWHKAEDMG